MGKDHELMDEDVIRIQARVQWAAPHSTAALHSSTAAQQHNTQQHSTTHPKSSTAAHQRKTHGRGRAARHNTQQISAIARHRTLHTAKHTSTQHTNTPTHQHSKRCCGSEQASREQHASQQAARGTRHAARGTSGTAANEDPEKQQSTPLNQAYHSTGISRTKVSPENAPRTA
jgi:hypothetical protein